MIKYKKIFITLIALFLFLLILFFSKDEVDKNSYGYQESIIIDYLENLKKGNVDAALENVYLTKSDKDNGYIDIARDALKNNFDCKKYEIKSMTKLCDNLFLAKIILNTNNNSKDKSIYVDEEFNPYLCFINNRSYIVYSKERIPEDIYDNLAYIPDNYQNMDNVVY